MIRQVDIPPNVKVVRKVVKWELKEEWNLLMNHAGGQNRNGKKILHFEIG